MLLGREKGGFPDRFQVHHRHVNVAHHFPLVLHLHTEQNATCAEDHGFHQILIEQALRRTEGKEEALSRETAKEGEKGSRGGGGGIPVDSLIMHPSRRQHRSPTFSSTSATHTHIHTKSSIYFPVMKTAAALEYNPG